MAPSESIAVTCRGIVKAYGAGSARVVALRGIDLEVRTGELMMLVGPSGCGKTTLISVIAGILDQDEGECIVFNHHWKEMTQNAKTKYRGQSIGFVFQAFNLLPTLTAAENVSVPLLVNGVDRRRATEKAKELLARVGLGDRAAALPSQHSGGRQPRVALARAHVHEPTLDVCDEPTSALDHETGHKVMALLRDVAMGAGRSLIIVTHDARIFEFADRMAKIDDGRVKEVVEGNGQR